MRLVPLALLFASCSDYDLGQTSDKPGREPEADTAPVDTDGGTTTGDTDVHDSGVVTDTDTTTDTPTQVPSGKIDVVLLMDIAYIYDCYHADLPLNTNALLDALYASGADVAVSIATYDDYYVSTEWFTATDGKPYILEEQLTTDKSRLVSIANRLDLSWGGDGPGSGYEALAQVADGAGYDQDCDGQLDSTTDIRPFNARSSDAFAGGVGGSADTSTPGTGTRPGVGWREGSKRIVVLFAENANRDRDEGHEFSFAGCSATKTRSAAADKLGTVEARFLGVNAYEFQDEDPLLQEQLVAIANQTHSLIDADHDGAYDDDAVLSGSWDWPATDVLVAAIWDLAR